jgi:hypothetical protein
MSDGVTDFITRLIAVTGCPEISSSSLSCSGLILIIIPKATEGMHAHEDVEAGVNVQTVVLRVLVGCQKTGIAA